MAPFPPPRNHLSSLARSANGSTAGFYRRWRTLGAIMSIGRLTMTKLNTGLRTALLAMALIVAPASTIAQRPHSTAADKPVWNQKAKDEVIEGMNRYLLNSAYVPGVDFEKWNTVIAKIKEQADKSKSEDEFASLINRSLYEKF